MLFPVKIKKYLIYKNVDFALFISIIRKIILKVIGKGFSQPIYFLSVEIKCP